MDKNRNDKINQEGKYSVYNYLYHYLLDNYEPENIQNNPRALDLLIKEGIGYARKGGTSTGYNFIRNEAQKAIDNFINNNGEHGDTAQNFGRAQSNSLKTIKDSMQDLRW